MKNSAQQNVPLGKWITEFRKSGCTHNAP